MNSYHPIVCVLIILRHECLILYDIIAVRIVDFIDIYTTRGHAK